MYDLMSNVRRGIYFINHGKSSAIVMWKWVLFLCFKNISINKLMKMKNG